MLSSLDDALSFPIYRMGVVATIAGHDFQDPQHTPATEEAFSQLLLATSTSLLALTTKFTRGLGFCAEMPLTIGSQLAQEVVKLSMHLEGHGASKAKLLAKKFIVAQNSHGSFSATFLHPIWS